MQVEAFAIRLRQRTAMEAADLGVRLCQSAAPSVFKCYLAVALPIMAFALAGIEFSFWISILALFCAKPWLDRTILFVLARAAFGQTTTVRDVWLAQRQVWWGQLFRTLTSRRLSPWRSFSQPVYQLEGLVGAKLRKRVRQIRFGNSGSALLVTGAFFVTELAVLGSLLLLAFFLAPQGYEPDLWEFFRDESQAQIRFSIALVYAIAIAAIEPFYVAAGFAMYLNRRVELEAWDIEQEFRRADFAHAAK